MQVFNTACPRNCYSTCSFRVWVEDGKVVKIDPQPLNKATPEGICLKGLSYLERVNSEDRLLYPLKRIEGQFERISWEQALQEITDKLTHYQQSFGNHSILFYAGSGMSGLLNGVSSGFWRLFGGATTVYGNLCWPAGLEATRLTLGENKHNVAWDLENAKLIVLWGKNPAETNIQQMIPIEKAQANGAKLVVIDPRRTPSSERADLLIQPKPGTDGILALAIARLLMDRDKIDAPFLQEHVLGYQEFKDSLTSFSIAKASEESGVSVTFIEKLAEWMGSIQPMTIVPGYGMQRFSNGGQTIRCLLALSIITGNIGKKGGCWHYADLQGDIFSDVKEPENYYPPKRPDGTFRRAIATARLGEQMLKMRDPELKMAWVERGNPLAQNPDSTKISDAFRKLEFKVVVEQFMTDTAQQADIILPAKSMFEQTDIISSYWNPYVQLKPKVVEPPGEVKPESEIYYLLAKRLGIDKDEFREVIPEPNDKAIEQWLQKYLDAFPELTLEKLKAGPQLAPGLLEIAFSDLKFNTPSGKIELVSQSATEKWGVSPLPTYVPPVEYLNKIDVSHPFSLMTPNTKNRIHSQFGNLKVIKSLTDGPCATISYRDAEEKAIQTGDEIRIFNDQGQIQIKVKVDASLRPGVVVVHNGYWHQEGACPNALTKGRETDMGHGTAFHDTMVNFEKV